MPYMLSIDYNGDQDLLRHDLLIAGIKPATADHVSVLASVLGSMYVAQGSIEYLESIQRKLPGYQTKITYQDDCGDGTISRWLRGEITLEEAEHESKRNWRS